MELGQINRIDISLDEIEKTNLIGTKESEVFEKIYAIMKEEFPELEFNERPRECKEGIIKMNQDTLKLLIDEIEGNAHEKIIRVSLKEKTIQEAYNLLNYETIEFEILNDNDEITKVKSNGYILLDAIIKALREQLLHNERLAIVKNILNNAKLEEAKKC